MEFRRAAARPPMPMPETPAWRSGSAPGRVLSAEEKAALMAGRPDLQTPAPVTPGKTPRAAAWK